VTKQEKAQKINSALKKLYPKSKIELNFNNPIELLVSVVLSAQATDKQVNIITIDLFKKYKKLDDYLNTPLSEFENDIRKIGLYRGKAKNILASLNEINKNYAGKVPDNMKELIALPGIGRKTANILLFNIYGKNEGIAVDTHVKRLSNKFGLTKQGNPDKIEKDLMELIPQKNWGQFSSRLVLYGRYTCKASCKHTDCPLRSYIS
jgi:endonuclease-3